MPDFLITLPHLCVFWEISAMSCSRLTLCLWESGRAADCRSLSRCQQRRERKREREETVYYSHCYYCFISVVPFTLSLSLSVSPSLSPCSRRSLLILRGFSGKQRKFVLLRWALKRPWKERMWSDVVWGCLGYMPRWWRKKSFLPKRWKAAGGGWIETPGWHCCVEWIGVVPDSQRGSQWNGDSHTRAKEREGGRERGREGGRERERGREGERERETDIQTERGFAE